MKHLIFALLALFSIKTFSQTTQIRPSAQLQRDGATNGQVLAWNGSAWVPQTISGGGGADNWGSQAVQTNATLSGDGTAGNLLKIGQNGAATGQQMVWNGTDWTPQDPLWQYGTLGTDIWQKPTGNVGISTAAPSEKLHVLGNVLADRFIGYGNNRLLQSNSAVGRNALAAITFGQQNTGTGFNALAATTSGLFNTATGANALAANTTASNNTADGANALAANTTGTANTAMGHRALTANTTGGNNVAVGKDALLAATTASDNVAIGMQAMQGTTTGGANIAIGRSALSANTTGTQNVGVGFNSMAFNATGSRNTAFGNNALNQNAAAFDNTAIGANALEKVTGGNNTAVGSFCAGNVSTGTQLTAIGYSALSGNTTGSNNIAIGVSAGSNIGTGSGNIMIGNGAQPTTGTASNEINLGNLFYAVGGFAGINTNAPTHQLTVNGDAAKTGGGTWAVFSDRRIKNDIKPLGTGLSEILRVNPVTYTLKTDKSKKIQTGVIAQELEGVLPLAVQKTNAHGYSDARVYDGGNQLLYTLVNAVKELSAKLDVANTEIAALKSKLK